MNFAVEMSNRDLEEQSSLISDTQRTTPPLADWNDADNKKKRGNNNPMQLNCVSCLKVAIVCIVCISMVAGFLAAVYYNGLGSYVGIYKDPPIIMPDAITVTHKSCEFNGMPYGEARRQHSSKSGGDAVVEGEELRYLPSFDTGTFSTIPRKWDIIPYNNNCTSTQQLDSNTCVQFSSKEVTCLPAVLLLGFEKCTTTELNMWLSYHPNIVSKWEEIRYLNHVNVSASGETDWYHYLKRLPSIPGGAKNVGKYFTVDKSPDNVLAAKTARVSAALLPNARFIIMLRNPTHRAYSMFAMYTRIYQWSTKSITISYIMKHTATGAVRFSHNPGPGGGVVPVDKRPNSYAGKGFTGEWKYIAFPPSPQDFQSYVNYSMTMVTMRFKYGASNWLPVLTNRQGRILFQGLYHDIIAQWLPYFSNRQILAIPMETLWNENVISNFNSLQKSLGLPLYDYGKVTSYDRSTKKYSLKSSGTDAMKLAFNTKNDVLPMLPETKAILDNMYCDSNRKLRALLGGDPLKGYSCADDD